MNIGFKTLINPSVNYLSTIDPEKAREKVLNLYKHSMLYAGRFLLFINNAKEVKQDS